MPPLFTIGAFNFLDIVGFPDPAKMQTAIEIRPGTDYHALWLTGSRGKPVTVQTWRDCTSFSDAVTAYENYRAAIGTSVNVIWADYVFNEQFDVLDVMTSPGNIKKMALGVGGTLGTSGGLLIAEWVLIQNDQPKT